MNRIHFDNLGNQKRWILLMIISLTLILCGTFEPIKFDNPNIYTYLSSIGFLIPVILFSRLFWFKNTVQWNKKGIVIRIKSFSGKSIRFDQIKETELHENELMITKTDGDKIRIDLSEITKTDSEKLNEIVAGNTIASNGY